MYNKNFFTNDTVQQALFQSETESTVSKRRLILTSNTFLFIQKMYIYFRCILDRSPNILCFNTINNPCWVPTKITPPSILMMLLHRVSGPKWKPDGPTWLRLRGWCSCDPGSDWVRGCAGDEEGTQQRVSSQHPDLQNLNLWHQPPQNLELKIEWFLISVCE